MLEERQDPIRWVRVENLYLDPENPRLSRGGIRTDQVDLLQEIYRRYNIADLLSSLSEHGYFSEEPLIAVQRDEVSESGEPTFTIVEGNRRLAALKLLLFETERQAVGARNIPTPTNGATAKLDPVPIKVYNSRDQIVPYLGVRHITGVKPWDSSAKAKYIERLVRSDYSIADITKMVASRSDVVCRLLFTLYVLNQANAIADEPWQEEAEGFSFSFLYTALGYTKTLNYIGQSRDALREPQETPVPAAYNIQLLYIMKDLYGSPDGTDLARISDSREIRKLAEIYGSEEAERYFRAGASLDRAWRKAGGERVELLQHLQAGSMELDNANSVAPHHKGDQEALRWANRCMETSKTLHDTLEDRESASESPGA